MVLCITCILGAMGLMVKIKNEPLTSAVKDRESANDILYTLMTERQSNDNEIPFPKVTNGIEDTELLKPNYLLKREIK